MGDNHAFEVSPKRMKTITDYSREFDIEAPPIFRFEFNEEIRSLISDIFEFDPEESHCAPGPSIGCRVRSESDIDFVALYLQYVPELVIFVEVAKDRGQAKRDFLAEVPELLPYLKKEFE